MILRRYSRPTIWWTGENVIDSMTYVEMIASEGYLQNLYTFKMAQIILDSLKKTLKFQVIRERKETYIDIWITLNNNMTMIKIDHDTFRYFIMTEYLDQLTTRLRILRQRLKINNDRWSKIEKYKEKYNKLIICIEGIEKFITKLINSSIWNYILWDIQTILKGNSYTDLTCLGTTYHHST